MPRKKRKQLSGAAKMKLYGKKPIMLGVLPDQVQKLRTAAALELRPVSQFVAFHALVAAEAILKSNPSTRNNCLEQ